jgi:hypothetical protein
LLSLEQWAKVQAGEDLGEEPIKRGGRREGISAALGPFEGRLDAETLRRLAIAVSVVIGVESASCFATSGISTRSKPRR